MNSTVAQPNASRSKKSRCLSIGLVAFGVLLLIFRSLVTDYCRAAFADDGVYIPEPTYSFVGQEAGEASHTFRIYNTRPRRLNVEAEPDCGCTGVSWTRAEIAPFGWKDLTAKMRRERAEQRSVSIELHTDSPARPWLFMFLKS